MTASGRCVHGVKANGASVQTSQYCAEGMTRMRHSTPIERHISTMACTQMSSQAGSFLHAISVLKPPA